MINKYNETYQIHNTIKTQSNTRKCKLLIINSNCFFLPASRNNHRHSLWKHCVQLCNPNPSPLLWELNLCEWLPCKKYGIQRANSKKNVYHQWSKVFIFVTHLERRVQQDSWTVQQKWTAKQRTMELSYIPLHLPLVFLLHMYICNKLRCNILVNYLLTDPNGSPTTRKATSSSSAPLNISSEICNENIIHVQGNDFFFSFQIKALSYKNWNKKITWICFNHITIS